MDESSPIVVVELPEFESSARKLFTTAERSALVTYVAARPDSGAVIPETGGVRKLRWKSKGKGKRGGARVIYFFHAAKGRVFFLTAYAKNQKEDLTPTEKKAWKKVVEILASQNEE